MEYSRVSFFSLDSDSLDLWGNSSDAFYSRRRGLPMSLFALASIVGSAVGATAMAWVDMDPRLGWRWIQWINGA